MLRWLWNLLVGDFERQADCAYRIEFRTGDTYHWEAPTVAQLREVILLVKPEMLERLRPGEDDRGLPLRTPPPQGANGNYQRVK